MTEVEIIKDERIDLNLLANYFFNELSNRITEQVLSRVENLFEIYNTPKGDDEYLTINETCKLVKKSRVTLDAWKKKGLLKPIAKSGVTPLYSKNEVLSFLTTSIQSNLNIEA